MSSIPAICPFSIKNLQWCYSLSFPITCKLFCQVLFQRTSALSNSSLCSKQEQTTASFLSFLHVLGYKNFVIILLNNEETTCIQHYNTFLKYTYYLFLNKVVRKIILVTSSFLTCRICRLIVQKEKKNYKRKENAVLSIPLPLLKGWHGQISLTSRAAAVQQLA